MTKHGKIGVRQFQHRMTIPRTSEFNAEKIYGFICLDLLEYNGVNLQQDIQWLFFGLGRMLLIRGLTTYTVSVRFGDHFTEPTTDVTTCLDERFTRLPKWLRFRENAAVEKVGDLIAKCLAKRTVPYEVECRIFEPPESVLVKTLPSPLDGG